MGMCPICGTRALPRAENRDAPFCSSRCKAVDLGKWLDEEYRVPAAPETQEEAALLEAAVSAAEEQDESSGDGSRKSVRN
jgi:uncharacterized protein